MQAEDQRIKHVEESFNLLRKSKRGFTDAFYQHLFAEAPEITPLFKNTSMEVQSEKLYESLILLVENLRNPELLASVLKPLGKAHVGYGVNTSHYPIIGKCLLDTLEKYLNDAWTPEVKKAWEETLNAVVSLMLEGAGTPLPPTEMSKEEPPVLNKNVDVYTLVEDSFTHIRKHKEKFAERFYELLFEESPQLKPLFKETNIHRQSEKLYESLVLLVENIRHPEVLQSVLGPLGQNHKAYGAIEQHYPYVGAALLKALEEYIGDDWTKEVAQAWTDTYGAVMEMMLAGTENSLVNEVESIHEEELSEKKEEISRRKKRSRLTYIQKQKLRAKKTLLTLFARWFWKSPKWVIGLLASLFFFVLVLIAQYVPGLQVVLDALEPLSIFLAVLLIVKESPERKRQFHYQAWSIIDGATGIENSRARIIALEDLCDDGVSLTDLDLNEARLQEIELNGADLSRVNFHKAQLNDAEMYYVNMDHANLSEANAPGIVLYRSNLSFANFKKGNFSSANLSKANLMFADLSEGNFSGANFIGAQMKGAHFEGAYMSGADLRGAEVILEDLEKAYLVNTILPDGTLHK